MRTTRYTARRGVTFLEVVLGVVLLGLVASTLGATVGAVGKSFQRQRDRLAAAEVASRLMLVRLDDSDDLPDPSKPIAYGDREFRWSISETPIHVVLAGPAADSIEWDQGAALSAIEDRLVSVTATAWLAETSGGTRVCSNRVPHASVTRVSDPLGFQTQDSAVRRLSTPTGRERYFHDLYQRLGRQRLSR